MPKWIKPSRVRAAISALFDWRSRAKNQPAMHLWPLLALIEKGVNTETWVRFTEDDDKAFWDRYGRLPGEARHAPASAPFTQDYYIEPLVLQLKPSDYYHRSPASIRVRTFLNSWGAAELNKDTLEWRLKPDYATIFEDKALSRGRGVSARVPIVDLAAYLFRETQFNDDADAAKLQAIFRDTFRFSTAAYDKIFEFKNEPEDNIFTNEKPTTEAVNKAIQETLVGNGIAPPQQQAIEVETLINEDDRHLIDVKKLLKLSSSGIIFRGFPGTSKTWYAKQIAKQLVANPETDIFQVQFHPSYGYEDFVEGYRPDPDTKSGFSIVDRIFLEARDRAAAIDTIVVFIIDEINRGDPARVFGELLTYIEHGYRGVEFPTALSGKKIKVPSNLVVFGTMNPHDRSTVQFDAALMRRFDHIDLEPDVEVVESFLTNAEERPTGFTEPQVTRIAQWFVTLQQILRPNGIGHTYFKDIKTIEDLRAVWDYRMFPYCANILELDPTALANAQRSFDAMIQSVTGQAQGADA